MISRCFRTLISFLEKMIKTFSGQALLEQFKALVDSAATNKTNLMINNGSYAHAQILFERIASEAKKSISLLTGTCDSYFYELEDVTKAFLGFIDRTKGRGETKIIFESKFSKDQIDDSKFISQLKKRYEHHKHIDSLKLYKLKDDKQIMIENGKIHILVADGDGPYRFEMHKHKRETKEENIENIYTDAIANFGDPEYSTKLLEFTDTQIRDNAEKIELN